MLVGDKGRDDWFAMAKVCERGLLSELGRHHQQADRRGTGIRYAGMLTHRSARTQMIWCCAQERVHSCGSSSVLRASRASRASRGRLAEM